MASRQRAESRGQLTWRKKKDAKAEHGEDTGGAVGGAFTFAKSVRRIGSTGDLHEPRGGNLGPRTKPPPACAGSSGG